MGQIDIYFLFNVLINNRSPVAENKEVIIECGLEVKVLLAS